MAALDQVLRNVGAELSNTFYVNGSAQDADGSVTVVVTKEDGTEIANETAQDNTSSDGKYEWTMPPQSQLTKLTLDWTGVFSGTTVTATTRAEIVGAFLFTIAEARAFQGEALSDTNKYTNAAILDTREEIATLFEDYCKVSFIPRYRREVISGNGKKVFYLNRAKVRDVYKLTEDGNTLTKDSDFYVEESGRVIRESATWSTLTPQNITVEYEHGYEFPPGPIARASLVLLKSLLVGSDLFDRATSHTDDSGTIRLSFPDAMRERPTGIPYVDTRLNEYTELWGVT